MYSFVVWVFCLITVGCTFLFIPEARTETKGKELVIVSIPWQKKERLATMYQPFMEYLGRSLNRRVRLVIVDQYKEAGEYLHHRTADLGILGGNIYVEARETYPELVYLATCKQPDAFYHSLIIVHQSSEIRSASDLAGKSFAYTSQESTSGYVYPRLMLQEAGIDPDTFFSTTFFLNKHDKVYNAVAQKSVDAGAVSITPWQKAVETNGEVFRIILKSDPIPRNAVVAGPPPFPCGTGSNQDNT